MSKRKPALYLQDIKDCVEKIKSYTENLSFDDFREDGKIIDALVRNLEIIGEAANNIPEEVKSKYPDIPWQKMISMRNKVIHEYFGVDTEIIWKTAKEDIPELDRKIKQLKIKQKSITL